MRGFGGELISEFWGKLVLLKHSLPNRASMLLLLTLLFKELLFHGASTVGEKKQGGKIPVVGNSWGRRSSREDLGAGSNAPAGCPWNLHARLVSLGKVSLSPVSVSLSDFGRRKLAQRIDDMGICANCISISFFSYVGPSSPTLSYLFSALTPVSLISLSPRRGYSLTSAIGPYRIHSRSWHMISQGSDGTHLAPQKVI